MTQDLAQYAKERNIQYFLFNFTDLFGNQRAKLVPAAAAGSMQKTGAGFAGFAAWLDFSPADPDMFVKPDPATVIQLPWKPEVAWVAGDCWMNDEPVAQAPRNVLKRLMQQAADKNMLMKSGVEPEFHLITPDGSTISDERDTQEKPCYDQSAVMRRYDVIAEICTTMTQLGWGPYQNDHEDANGQFEINWDFNDALTTADQLAFFKFMVKSIAEKHGLRATFMPKPFSHLTGNGCHVHISVWSNDGKTNRFADENGELGLSSYKRINAPPTLSGATWSPSSITFGGNNRTHMIRIPDDGRIELRLPDGAANPYLLMAVALAAGMHGVDDNISCGERLDINMYTEAHTVANAKQLPLNLLDAIRCYEKDNLLCEAMGSDFSQAYCKLKRDQWTKYTHELTDWERENTLDC